MKVLIVDDEILIRQGLKQQIDWGALCIDTVLEADDGQHALELARQERPELVLTDVRMPHMDGIAFAQQFSRLLPESQIIFMSGYSDKEYLKAAISLKAISYVEKPIVCAEVQAALCEALRVHTLNERNKDAHNLRICEEKERLALALTRPDAPSVAEATQLQLALGLCVCANTRFATVLASFAVPATKAQSGELQQLLATLQQYCAAHQMQFLHAFKYDQYFISHVSANIALTDADVLAFAQCLQKSLVPFAPFTIAVGPVVQGAARIPASYQEAVLLLQSGFFREENALIACNEPLVQNLNLFLERCPAQYSAALQEQNEPAAQAAADQLSSHLKNCRTLTPAQIKDIYYRLFVGLEETALEKQLSLVMDGSLYTAWEVVSACASLAALHKLLCQRTAQFFCALGTHNAEHQSVFLMKEYVRCNYSVDTLSVKDISDHVFLSVAYTCTLFKAETGQTINQFITEFRIEKARQLLANARYKITDIAAQVGYCDSGYFGKIFRKIVGLSPSEYREKMLP